MFQFSGSSYRILFYSYTVVRVLLWRVPPFGHLRIYGYLLLPAAFRSLSRPSSAPDAKAFVVCSSSLDRVKTFLSLSPSFLSKKCLFLKKCFSSCTKSKLFALYLWVHTLRFVKLLEQSLVLLEFLINYVSKSFAFSVLFDTSAAFAAFTVTLFYLKKPFLFSYSFSYSVFKHLSLSQKASFSGTLHLSTGFEGSSQAWCLKSSQ